MNNTITAIRVHALSIYAETSTGDTINIPARKVAKFKPGKALQDTVNE